MPRLGTSDFGQPTSEGTSDDVTQDSKNQRTQTEMLSCLLHVESVDKATIIHAMSYYSTCHIPVRNPLGPGLYQGQKWHLVHT